ncbi:MAG TPA: tetratricopeptide repeat protein [bacterium]|nr:tetratricopeptide repeat protein [bacterium]
MVAPRLAGAQPAPAAVPTPAAGPSSIDTQYQHSLDLYEHGDYAEAAKNLKDVIENAPPGFDRDKLKRAWLYRGISLFLTSDRPGAEKSFWQVLLLDPEYRPDPLFTLPAIIQCFDGVRADHAEQLKNVPRVGKRVDNTPRDPMGVPLTNDPSQGNFVDAIAPVVPFGYAQYRNRQPGKALALGISEGTLVAVIGGTFVSFQSMRQPGNHFHSDEVSTARLDKTLNNGAYLLLIGELVYGAIDGVYYSSGARRPPVERRGPQLAPGPGTAGIGVELRF